MSKNIEKHQEDERNLFSSLLNQLKNSLSPKSSFEKEKPLDIWKKDLLSLEQEVLTNFNDSKKLEESTQNLNIFKKTLDSLKFFVQSSTEKSNNPLKDIYQYKKSDFDQLEIKFWKEKILKLMQNIANAGLNPQKNSDAWRIDSIVSMYQEVPPFIARFLF